MLLLYEYRTKKVIIQKALELNTGNVQVSRSIANTQKNNSFRIANTQKHDIIFTLYIIHTLYPKVFVQIHLFNIEN